jgi:hypothetical protein
MQATNARHEHVNRNQDCHCEYHHGRKSWNDSSNLCMTPLGSHVPVLRYWVSISGRRSTTMERLDQRVAGRIEEESLSILWLLARNQSIYVFASATNVDAVECLVALPQGDFIASWNPGVIRRWTTPMNGRSESWYSWAALLRRLIATFERADENNHLSCA